MHTGKCIYYTSRADHNGIYTGGATDHNGICCFCISDKLAASEITDEQARSAAERMSYAELHAALHSVKCHADHVKLYGLIKDLL